jgi:serine/threonine-protein kinase RsbT
LAEGVDSAPALLAALEQNFAPLVARTLLMVARRRAGCRTDAIRSSHLASVVRAIEESLPAYVADAQRRRMCEDAVRATLGRTDSPGRPAASTAPTRLPVNSDADLRLVTDTVRTLSRQLGMSVLDQTKIMTASAELARNMLQYAHSGEFNFWVLDRPRKGLGISAVDRGPGIPDIAKVMAPGYVSRTGMGIGLQGAKRLVDEFEIDSSVARGTSVMLRKYV